MDLNKMTPRQLTAGLMRGNRIEMKMGYSPEAAASAAARRAGWDNDSPEFKELLAYAQGFADGLVEDGTQGLMPERQSDAAMELEDIVPDGEHRIG